MGLDRPSVKPSLALPFRRLPPSGASTITRAI
jgi:hypothetical protein